MCSHVTTLIKHTRKIFNFEFCHYLIWHYYTTLSLLMSYQTFTNQLWSYRILINLLWFWICCHLAHLEGIWFRCIRWSVCVWFFSILSFQLQKYLFSSLLWSEVQHKDAFYLSLLHLKMPFSDTGLLLKWCSWQRLQGRFQLIDFVLAPGWSDIWHTMYIYFSFFMYSNSFNHSCLLCSDFVSVYAILLSFFHIFLLYVVPASLWLW